ncbi:MAG: hypothetical protein ArsCj_1850 [Arsenophonus endosymbiont of Ceratovacuna japonica]
MSIKLLRDKIDEIDKSLIILLGKRIQLVKDIGKIKFQQGLSIYDPNRETLMFNTLYKEAEKIGISTNLIKNIFYYIIRESYLYEKINH